MGSEVCAAVGGVVQVHFLLATLLAERVDHGGYLGGGEEGMATEGAGSDAFFYADYFATVKAVGRCCEEGVAGCEAGAAAGCWGGVAKGGVGLQLESADGGVLENVY